jgi:hypothetical protein
MAEVYPSDNELLNILNDDESGVEYIPTGTAPYYLHFRKLLWRLLLVAKRGNDFRVFDEGGLDIGIKSGKFWVGDSLVEYGGGSLIVLADDKASIYVYIDSTGALVTTEYAGFPDMASIVHVRLAIVSTSGGDVLSIEDARDHHSVALGSGGAGGEGGIVVEAHTVDDTLTVAESGSFHTNRGSTGMITLTLPDSAPAGTMFTFAVQEGQALAIDPGVGAIRDAGGQTAGKYKWADYIGESMKVVADGNGDWISVGRQGTWIEES